MAQKKQLSLAELRAKAMAAVAAHQHDMATDPAYRAAAERADRRSIRAHDRMANGIS